jgi:hypothetical protein
LEARGFAHPKNSLIFPFHAGLSRGKILTYSFLHVTKGDHVYEFELLSAARVASFCVQRGTGSVRATLPRAKPSTRTVTPTQVQLTVLMPQM